MITVLLVDDEPLVRSGLRAVLDSEDDVQVVGEVEDGSEVVPAVRALRPAVVLMDVRMPRIDGIRATRLVNAAFPEPPKIIVLTTFGTDDYVYEALLAGAAGFLLKRARTEEIVHAVRLTAAGDSLLFPDAVRNLALAHRSTHDTHGGLRDAGLTPREGEVLRRMATGMSNAEIAADFVVGIETVKTHVGNVLAKLHARDRTQAVVIAYESGFITG